MVTEEKGYLFPRFSLMYPGKSRKNSNKYKLNSAVEKYVRKKGWSKLLSSKIYYKREDNEHVVSGVTESHRREMESYLHQHAGSDPYTHDAQ